MSSVTFPSSTDPPVKAQAALRPFPPFRRISLPTKPSNFQRVSTASAISFDSLPEEQPPELQSGLHVSPSTPRQRPISMNAGPSKPRARTSSSKRRSDVTKLDTDKAMKKKQVVDEIINTERTYVQGLELIYEHFLSPLVASLDTKTPILSRSQLTSVFSNFVDIWNFHRTFLTSIMALDWDNPTNRLSTLLLDHFPYLSLYTPFIASFPMAMSSLTNLCESSPAFLAFLRAQESHPRCNRLSLYAWLLTVVQRCPRYVLLVKDLLPYTDPSTDEYSELNKVHHLVTKITESLNSALQNHSQMLSLLALQRGTPNLSFPLIAPGRRLLKRGTLLQIDREQHLREFLLFSDCLVWLNKGGERETEWSTNCPPALPASVATTNPVSSMAGLAIWDHQVDTFGPGSRLSSLIRPLPSVRPISISDSDLPTWSDESTRQEIRNREERWWFRGRIELMDIEVVTSTLPALGESRRFDVFSPAGSYALYTATVQERDSWAEAIRVAKEALLHDLNLRHPNSTLTSSSSTNHLRRALQALPYLENPSDVTITSNPGHTPTRQKVDHFVPAIWVPDGKTNCCQRCGQKFNRVLRRRHHCRLCGRVVCATCSARTFFISDHSSTQDSKPARACNLCYDAIFPVVEPSPATAQIPPHLAEYSESSSTSPGFSIRRGVSNSDLPTHLAKASEFSSSPVPIPTQHGRSFSISMPSSLSIASIVSSGLQNPSCSEESRDSSLSTSLTASGQRWIVPTAKATKSRRFAPWVPLPSARPLGELPFDPRGTSEREPSYLNPSHHPLHFSSPSTALHHEPIIVVTRPHLGLCEPDRQSLIGSPPSQGSRCGELKNGPAFGKLNALLQRSQEVRFRK